ncbi:PP0621 family protein [Hydrogenophaga sp. NFH-34]|uniref:PP0621 family protein n=1 Tax=Hydrogenophaga sp. NFH-34 TaxID=2744446 RepID=UPI001F1CF8C2|nr:PP0621 family protein [Hydrogenophaga sp. NFH-34]
MKYLLVLFVLLVAFWIWRNNRLDRQPPDQRAQQPGAGSQLQAMVACTHCQTHVPDSEAVRDTTGRPYCCPEHLRQARATPR